MGIIDVEALPQDLIESTNDALSQKGSIRLAKLLQVEIKPNKYDQRLLVLCDYTLHIVTPKLPVKIEQSINLLEIQSIHSTTVNKVKISSDHKRLMLMHADEDTKDIDELIYGISEAFVCMFPSSLSLVLNKLSLSPETRLSAVEDRLNEARSKTIVGPCGGFTSAFRCACDYHNVPFVDEIAWDIDTIYLSQANTELNLNDFDHLDARVLLPMLSALEYNDWFTKLTVANIKLFPETSNELLRILKTNTNIEELVLSNVGFKWDLIQRLNTSLVANAGCKISRLDLSWNPLEDKGVKELVPAVQKLQLSTLNLSHCSLSAKGVNRVAEVLSSQQSTFSATLKHLNLSGNALKGEDITTLHNFLASLNHLTELNLSMTECCLETLFSALLSGCQEYLSHLDISHNVYNSRRSTRDASVPTAWKEFFSSCKALQFVNFSGNRLPVEALRSVMSGLVENTQLKSVAVNLSSNALGASGSHLLETFVANVRCITSLDVSDNGFDQCIVGLLQQLCKNKSICKLSIGRNLSNIKPKHVQHVVDAIVQLIQVEHSPIQCLSVDDMKLRTDLVALLNAVGCNDTLTELNISGNQAGDIGARALSKALMLNCKLHSIAWDQNGTSSQGLSDVAQALHRNHTLTSMAMPVSDTAAAFRVSPEKTEAALLKIEKALRRNNLPQRLAIEETYRLHSGLLVSSSQRMIEKSVSDLELVIGKLTKDFMLSEDAQEEVGRGLGLIKDAGALQKLMSELQRIALACDDESSVVPSRLHCFGNQLQNDVESQLQKTVAEMLQQAEFHCPVAFSGREAVKQTIEERSSIKSDVIQQFVSQNLGFAVRNAVNAANFSVANYLCDKMTEEVLAALLATLSSLRLTLSGLMSRRTPGDDDLHDTSSSNELQQLQSSVQLDTFNKAKYSRKLRPQSTVDHSAFQIVDSKGSPTTTGDASPSTDLDTASAEATSRKNSAALGGNGVLKAVEGRPPVPVFRKRTSTSGISSTSETTASAHENREGCRSNGSLADLAVDGDLSLSSSSENLLSDDSGTGSKLQSSSSVKTDKPVSSRATGSASQETEAERRSGPSLMSAVLATSAASIAMITIQGPLPAVSPESTTNVTAAVSVVDKKGIQLDINAFPTCDPCAPKLSHLSKSRPRNPRTHAVTRVTSVSLPVRDVSGHDDGLDKFFSVGSSTQFDEDYVEFKVKESSKSKRKQESSVSSNASVQPAKPPSHPPSNLLPAPRSKVQSPSAPQNHRSQVRDSMTTATPKSVASAGVKLPELPARQLKSRTKDDDSKSESATSTQKDIKADAVSETSSRGSTSSLPLSAARSRPPPPAPKPKKFTTPTSSPSTPSGPATAGTAVAMATISTPMSTTASKSENSSPAKPVQPQMTRGFSVRQYMKRFSETPDPPDDICKEIMKENIDTKCTSEPAFRRTLSVREKAAAFMETSSRDSNC